MESLQLAFQTAAHYNILPLTSGCNLRCLFCSHRQNPPGVETWYLPPLKLDHIETLLDFLDGSRKIVIGESATRLIEGEPLTHPDFLAILTRVRQRFPGTRVEITTNGTLLTPDLARAMADLGPLEINLSLNSASPEGRLKLMGDTKPAPALEAPLTLHQAGIPYHGSLVACPWLVGWQDVRETVLHLARSGARTVRIFLPGYTRLAPPELRFPGELRQQLAGELEELRSLTDIPLLLEPPFLPNLIPVIEGVIPGTPAAAVGLQRGDLVLEVDGRQPRCRVEAYRLASVPGRRRLLIGRRQRPGPGGYAGTPATRDGWQKNFFELQIGEEGSGLTFTWDFDPDLFIEVEKICRRHGAGRAVVLTSQLAAMIVEQALAALPLSLHVVATPSRFFGGSIGCAGLLTLADFRAAWQEQQGNGRSADLIILPAIAFDYRGRDLVGEHYLDLAELTNIPVELI
ncbi:MAG: hypothetical protein PWQ18_580 [Clostridia bacterium]|nr:hypothetical protein [Clostridia bacterium]